MSPEWMSDMLMLWTKQADVAGIVPPVTPMPREKRAVPNPTGYNQPGLKGIEGIPPVGQVTGNQSPNSAIPPRQAPAQPIQPIGMPSVSAQVGREQGGQRAILANIRDMFLRPKTADVNPAVKVDLMRGVTSDQLGASKPFAGNNLATDKPSITSLLRDNAISAMNAHNAAPTQTTAKNLMDQGNLYYAHHIGNVGRLKDLPVTPQTPPTPPVDNGGFLSKIPWWGWAGGLGAGGLLAGSLLANRNRKKKKVVQEI